MIILENIALRRGQKLLFADVSSTLQPGQKIALIGGNGCGKSSLFALLLNDLQADAGDIRGLRGLRISHMAQETETSELTARDYVIAGDAALYAVLQDLAKADAAGEFERSATLHQQMEELDGYSAERRAEQLLLGLGFQRDQMDTPMASFSGGWRIRLNLARALMAPSDLMLLDEPTNHLDIEVIEWLEEELRSFSGAIVTISHDRTFLDRVCNQIVETERGISRSYLGNYSQHLEQKVLEREASQSAFDRQQKELAAQQAYIDRFRASATRSTQAKSREKLLDKVERIDAPVESLGGPQFQFPPAPRSGRQIALIDNLTHHYDDNILFLEANLEVERGDRIAFVGPNGAGKSTLLRLVMGLEQPSEGSARLGEHNVEAGYFEQNQAEALDLEKTVIDTLFEAVPDWTQTQVRSLLGSFCFSNDAVFKQVGQLSGGEKARLALALMLLTPCNLLVLDEPTNHLDIPAKQMLEDALMQYEGAALLVSHDRTFIARVANRIVELRDGELVLYRGDYAYYLEKKEEEAALLRQAEEDEAREAKRAANRAKQKSKAESRRKRPT